jgi:peptidoglycan LD-endopeptidase LytH
MSGKRQLLATLVALTAMTGACAPYGPSKPGQAPRPASAPEVSQAGDEAAAILDRAVAPVLADVSYLRDRGLVIPVAGADATRIRDSFHEARDGGARTHHALDIMAPKGTPILSADDGHVLRLSTNKLGGITVYSMDPAARVVYYYAHLDRYHPGLHEGQQLSRGDTLGYVGTTGNAPANAPHLHFQVMRMPDDGRYWAGEPINPFPVLREARR